jgi:uncharacterized protein YaaW (UPF0174 family)
MSMCYACKRILFDVKLRQNPWDRRYYQKCYECQQELELNYIKYFKHDEINWKRKYIMNAQQNLQAQIQKQSLRVMNEDLYGIPIL